LVLQDPLPRRGRSAERRDSRHPRVGFRNPLVTSDSVQSHHYTTTSLETSDSSDSEPEQLKEPGSQTSVQVAITPNASAKTVACRSRSPGREPWLMIVEALTHNFNSKADQLLTVFLDSGSQHSFIYKDTARFLGLQFKHPKTITATTFGGHQHTEKSYQVKITLQNPVTGTPVRLKLWTRTHITSVPDSMSVKTTAQHQKHPRTGSINVDVLVGMDYYWSVVHLNRSRQLSSGLVKSYTKLGSLLSGSNAPFPRVLSTSVDQKAINADTDSVVRRLLALDSEGLDEDRDTADSEVIQQYYNKVQVIQDASKRVFAAAVCRLFQPFSHLIYAKAKLAAPEETTIPRLELQALVLDHSIIRFLKKELTIQISSVQLLSDSEIALYWIHSKKQLKTFVHNRVELIHEVKNELETANIHCRPKDVGLLITCMSTRTIHLKLVVDNTITYFLLAFRRFISRRDTPNLVISDNAPTFKLGQEVLVNELRQFMEDRAVLDFCSSPGFEWRFITPLSPWKGGFYERLVGSVKTALKKTVHRNTLDLCNLQTLLTEIVSTLNTRPFTPLSGKATEPVHILRPIDLVSSKFSLVTESQEFLVCQYSLLRDSLKTFWELWHKEYLQALAERSQIRFAKQQSAARQPQVGDVVLIQTDNTSRSNWPLGLIVKINSSADSSVRSIGVKTGKNKILDRSVNQLIPLEVVAEDTTLVQTKKQPGTPTRIQPPRKLKKTFTT
uniref:Integrase catalytic domain-containing protein n=1 Tax=Heligmosomoides polygyrus TaxID=6339 RepID=A0A183GSM3_HELPZ